MGARLMKYYQYINEKMGLAGKQKLAFQTKIPSLAAATAPDSEENVRKFMEAVKSITNERAPLF